MTEKFLSAYETESAFECPTCGDPIDPYGADTLEAIELALRGGDGEDADGVAVFFHEDCFPYASARYQLL